MVNPISPGRRETYIHTLLENSIPSARIIDLAYSRTYRNQRACTLSGLQRVHVTDASTRRSVREADALRASERASEQKSTFLCW